VAITNVVYVKVEIIAEELLDPEGVAGDIEYFFRGRYQLAKAKPVNHADPGA
jgi:hypothetical protein